MLVFRVAAHGDGRLFVVVVWFGGWASVGCEVRVCFDETQRAFE